jgi:hypothetical protein
MRSSKTATSMYRRESSPNFSGFTSKTFGIGTIRISSGSGGTAAKDFLGLPAWSLLRMRTFSASLLPLSRLAMGAMEPSNPVTTPQ